MTTPRQQKYVGDLGNDKTLPPPKDYQDKVDQTKAKEIHNNKKS